MNLSISDFQKISNGSYNAGDITLTKGGQLDKVNNHVGILKGWNTKTISAATTLEVKNAFVQALKNAGIDEAALAGVREELGLPKGGSVKGFDMSSLKPLTRAQTREILDRFAGTINQNAGRTVVSNRWAALKAADDQNYKDHFDIASRTNRKSVEDRVAAKLALAAEIQDEGVDALPKDIRKSPAFAGLSEAEKDRFAKIFSVSLLMSKGEAAEDSIAAETMKKVLVSKYGKGMESRAARDIFASLAGGIPATTDLSRIEAEIKAARDASAGARLSFGFKSKEMRDMSYSFRTTGGLGRLASETARKSTPKTFLDDFAKALSKDEAMKLIASKFGASVKNLGVLELYGEPSCKTAKLENGNTQLVLSFDAGIGGDKQIFGGKCVMRFEIDSEEKSFLDFDAEMKLEPALKFPAKGVPLALHKMQILEDAKKIAQAYDQEMTEDAIGLMKDQMSQWEDMQTGRMKNFEDWSKREIAKYIDTCISGNVPKEWKSPLEFDENGLCLQFRKDGYRSHVTVGNNEGETKFQVSRSENTKLNDCIKSLLPNEADRKLVTAIMNQSTVANLAILTANAADPDDMSEDPPSLRSLDPEGDHLAYGDQFKENFLITVAQPKSQEDLRYELKVDDKKNTATITITVDYALKASDYLGGGILNEAGSFGKVSYAYKLEIAGLGSGKPQIASVGFMQDIKALGLE